MLDFDWLTDTSINTAVGFYWLAPLCPDPLEDREEGGLSRSAVGGNTSRVLSDVVPGVNDKIPKLRDV